jgi:hypothetical protein
METDPEFADSWDVFVKGEPTERHPANPDQYLYEFVYDTEKGVVAQGTGVTKEGEYITIDHARTEQEYGSNWINEQPGRSGVSAHRSTHKNILHLDGTQKKQEFRGYIPMEDSLLEN